VLACAGCHTENRPGRVGEGRKRAHFAHGVDCCDCHKAKEGDKDALRHKQAFIRTAISPKNCASCHEMEVAQQQPSHHAKAGMILASLDNLMGEVARHPLQVLRERDEPRQREVGGRRRLHRRTDPRRDKMKDVCSACHGDRQIDGHDWYFNGLSKNAIEQARKGCALSLDAAAAPASAAERPAGDSRLLAQSQLAPIPAQLDAAHPAAISAWMGAWMGAWIGAGIGVWPPPADRPRRLGPPEAQCRRAPGRGYHRARMADPHLTLRCARSPAGSSTRPAVAPRGASA
jgi:hypothetical protein